MRAIAAKKLPVCDSMGRTEENRYIAKGDRCELGEITQNLLIPVSYPTAKGMRSAYVRSLEGFIRG